MKIKIGNELLALNLLILLLVAIIIFAPSSNLRIVLGLPILLFCPGYTLVATLFPNKQGIGAVERIILSFGVSIAVVSLFGLALNYTDWGITQESVLYSVASFIFLTSIAAFLRRTRVPENERICIGFHLRLPKWGGSTLNKFLSVMLTVSILAVVGILGYALAKPKIGERFTEFNILPLEGEVVAYPQELKIGETGWVIVGIVNREREPVTYRVVLLMDGVKNNEVGPVMLEQDGKWQATLGFTPDRLGSNQKVEFLLYKNEESEAHSALHFWVDVKE